MARRHRSWRGSLTRCLRVDARSSDAPEIVGKAAEGNIGALARYGIMLKEGATATEAFATLQQKFGGQSEAFANTQPPTSG